MSVARSAYRQLLRVGRAVSAKYVDQNDMCFALFGVLVSRHDFINAGYGSTFPAILRTCFLRPSVAGDAHDTTSARTSAAFDALRRLNELRASNAAFGIRELRRVMADAADQKYGTTAVDAGEEAPPPSPAPQPSPAPSPSSSSPPSTEQPVASQLDTVASGSTVATTHTLDEEGVHLIRGSVLIERSSRRRIQNFTRHCVVCEPISMTFPPYRFCVPPEPSYLLAVRSEFALYALTDVLLALSATSIFNAHRQAYIARRQALQPEQLQEPSSRPSPGDDSDATAAQSADCEAVNFSGGIAEHAQGGAAGTAAAPEPRRFPATKAELTELVHRIPTRTVMQTDVLEVEVTTEYLCSNPTAADQAASPRKEGSFASTTPLKRGPAGEANADGREASDDSKAHLFLYYVTLRNRGPMKNPKRWHAQVLSHHLVVVDVAQAQVLEMGRPGVVGNFPLLQPGASHCFESGTTLAGPEGILRGSIQVNLFNQAGEVVILDAAIAPTRLTVEVTTALPFSSPSNYKDELVQRSSNASPPFSDATASASAPAATNPPASTTAGKVEEPDDKGTPKDDGK